jgi:hypothetical protein
VALYIVTAFYASLNTRTKKMVTISLRLCKEAISPKKSLIKFRSQFTVLFLVQEIMMLNMAETTLGYHIQEAQSYPCGNKDDSLVSSYSERLDDKTSMDNLAHQIRLSEQEQECSTLACHENKAVSLLRVTVFIVLSITAGTIVPIGVLCYTTNDQQSNFETDFDANAAKLLELFHNSVESKLEAVDAFAVTITPHALHSGSLPDLALRSANTCILADCVVLSFHPLVTDEACDGWEAYEKEHQDLYDAEFVQDWMQQALQDARFIQTADANTGARHLQQEEEAVEFDIGN